ncbi:MAG TPA: RNA 2',3'-cyclic phosphodiesterase [Candidatus Kapabacteria bacterium]|nr:RNA 2',3'-cyclic phosphodiesterase [Candidatus Kapabacteria bacterium]HPO62619.1 RNA 2',3'-cyclic phosphodiesterase [Candidatus Kapabacteria bacterium]
MKNESDVKRLFIGAYIDKNVFVQHLFDLKRKFYNLCSGKWVEAENIHFTFKFLGDTKIELIPEILNALQDELKCFDSKLIFDGLGCFPKPQNPRVLYVNIKNNENIMENIFNSIEKKLTTFKIPKETNPFKSHITLCRLKSFNNPQFKEEVEKYKLFYFGEMSSFKVLLIESKLTPKGPIYTVIK